MILPFSALLLLIPLKLISLVIVTRGTVSGNLKPDRVSLILWALAPLIGFAIAISNGAPFSAIPLLLAGAAPLFILGLTFFSKHKPWKTGTVEYASGLFSLIAIIVWIFAHDPVLATIVAIIADIFAALPTIIKTWKAPKTESLMMYVLGGIGNVIGLATLTVWTIPTAGFSIYLTLLGIAMMFVIAHKSIARRFIR
ncbi:MAG: hypothetical protein JWM20_148 [Patescibacteria group bacterium]|nr:hypothetical protein [Patescibacteria group bacterium]